MKTIFFAAGSDGDIHTHFGLGCELRDGLCEVVFLILLNYVEMARTGDHT